MDVRIAQTEVPKSIGIAAPTTEEGGGPFFGESVRDRCGKRVFVIQNTAAILSKHAVSYT